VRARLVRRAAVVGGAAVAVTLLSGCRSNVNVAATVNGERISESTVARYVNKSGPDPAALAQVQQQGQQVPEAKPFVLELLIREKLLERTLAAHGGVPTSGQLATQRATAATTVQQELTVASAAGASSDFKSEVERFVELDVVLETRLHPTSAAQFFSAIAKAGAHVRVNPRYGVWQPAQLALNSSGSAGLPNYLKLQPTPGAAAQQGLPAS
jgi:hypothetical protein